MKPNEINQANKEFAEQEPKQAKTEFNQIMLPPLQPIVDIPKVPLASPAFDAKQFGDIIAMSITQSRIDSERHTQMERAAQHALKTQQSNYNGMAGKASDVFIAQMKKEIADGKCYDFFFSKHMAATMAGHRNFKVNGYTIVLQEGKTTKVPFSLKTQLDMFIEGLEIGKEIRIEKVKGYGGELDAAEQAAWNRQTGGMF